MPSHNDASFFDDGSSVELRLSEIISAFSCALDITEGQPEGHAVRTCLIGMQIGERLGFGAEDRSNLFYALLLKDLGCSSNAAKMCFLFGADERKVKRNLKTVNWSKMTASFQFMTQNVQPDGSPLQRALRGVVIALEGPAGARKLVETRCERGAEITRKLGLSEVTATAILHLDEHWDGKGQPLGLKKEAISLLGRIAGLAQTLEVFYAAGGPQAALQIARDRRGSWFDPAIVDAFLACAGEPAFWEPLLSTELQSAVSRFEPEDRLLMADEPFLDRIVEAFAEVVDAKSPWTFRHSDGVARIAVGIARVLGFSDEQLREVRRAGLLHDIGKLGVSNLILDKPGKLTDDEFVELRRHPEFTQRILGRIACLRDLAETAGAHHERLDGRGYHRGIPAADLPAKARLLVVADICEALSAKRPYRDEMPPEKVRDIMGRDAGKAICPECFDALKVYQNNTECLSRVDAQIAEVDRVLAEV